jgi:hypothetical protein
MILNSLYKSVVENAFTVAFSSDSCQYQTVKILIYAVKHVVVQVIGDNS